MNEEYYRMKIREFLYSRNVKNPSIRLNALERVFSYMKSAGGFIKNGVITLFPERNKTLEIIFKEKGKDLSSSEKHVVKLMYDYYKAPGYLSEGENSCAQNKKISSDTKDRASVDIGLKEVETKLTKGVFLTVNELENGMKVPVLPGIYCIKIRKGVFFPKDYGKIREDGVIYIGKAESSLRSRLWDQELNHNGYATFFRSIGAMLDKRPPKSSLYGKNSRNYEFDYMDTEFIKNWMRQSLLVNFISLPVDKIREFEGKLIKKYCPLVNLQGNPNKSKAIQEVREECVRIAQSNPGV